MTDLWSGLVGGYMNSRTARRRLAPTSRATYRGVLTDLAGYLADTGARLASTPDELACAVDHWLEDRHWSANTCCTNLGIVRPFFNWAAQRGHVAGGVSALLANPRRTAPLPRAMSPKAVGALLGAVPDKRGMVIVLLECQCGLRRAEVAGLTMRDVDLVDGSILVHGKGGKERRVYPSAETMDAIRLWLVERGQSPGALICAYSSPGRHMTPTWIGIMVTRWMRDAGLKTAPRDGVSGHALRHTAATQMLRNGTNVRVVQAAMGHESIVTTARYLRADDPEVRTGMAGVPSYGPRRLRAVTDEVG